MAYEVTPASPVEGHHAGPGLDLMIHKESLKELVLLSLEERRLRRDVIAVPGILPDGGYQRKQSPTLTKSAG